VEFETIIGQEATELANLAFTLPANTRRKLSRTERVREFLGGNFSAATSGYALAKGRRPRYQELTFRGKDPPALARFYKEHGEYRPDGIPFDTLDQMRKSAQVKLGLAFRAAPVLTALREARIECADKNISAFVKETFVEPFLASLARSSLTADIYGVSFHEKVWWSKPFHIEGPDGVAWDGPALVYKKFKWKEKPNLPYFWPVEH